MNNIEYLSTFASFYRGPIFKKSNILIPYINIGILPHTPLNDSDELIHVNYAYLFFKNAELHDLDLNKYENLKKKNSIEFLGGTNLDQGAFKEYMISFDESQLILTEISKLQRDYWIPYDDENFKKNLKDEEMRSFFSLVYLDSNNHSL